jgi:hypothetical protein
MIKQTKYYNLNIKLSSEIKTDKPDLFDATYNLEERSRAPIFFGPYKPEEYISALENNEKLEGLNKKQLQEACNFIQLYKKDPEARLITIDEKIWIYKIIGQIKYESTDVIVQKKNDQISEKIVPKYYDIKIIETCKIEDKNFYKITYYFEKNIYSLEIQDEFYEKITIQNED